MITTFRLPLTSLVVVEVCNNGALVRENPNHKGVYITMNNQFCPQISTGKKEIKLLMVIKG